VRRRTLLVALLALLALLTGCANDPTVDLSDWQLTTPDGAVRPVRIPVHIDRLLPRAEVTYVLRAHAVLPEAMRGRPLTFALPLLQAKSELDVDGEAMTPLDADMLRGYRGIDQASYRIPAELSRRGELDLTLRVDYVSILASRLDIAPRISATLEGDRLFRVVRDFNQWTCSVAAVVILVTAFSYGLVYVRDRRRKAYGWWALQGLSGGVIFCLFYQGSLQLVLGHTESFFVPLGIFFGEYASIWFTHLMFGLGRPHRIWTFAMVYALLLALAFPSPFIAPYWVSIFTATPMTLINTTYQAWVMIRLWRGRGPSLQVVVVLLSWVQLAMLGMPDIVMWFGLGELAGGMRTVPLGLMLFALMQAYVLSREHHDALVTAEHVNEELRRQIASRADTLAAALTRASLLGAGAHTLDVGERLDGRYEIVRHIGEGGAGIVYEAKRASDGARLAVKLLRGAADATDMARFAREAQLISKLDHPNVVRIVDVDVSRTGFFYIVVELVEGLSLAQHRARFGDVRWATSVLVQVADGLTAIHGQGIIHRDLKPGNILVTPGVGSRLEVKIADFGIASAGQVLPDAVTLDRPPPLDASSDLTATGSWIGTPRYMAPELADGAKHASAASDIFGFGIIAYEMLSGAFPFDGSAALQRLKGHVYESPTPLARLCPSLGPAIASVIDRCLAEHPKDRPDAAAIARVLRGTGAVAAE
jgi:serine/threonine-protein kinase